MHQDLGSKFVLGYELLVPLWRIELFLRIRDPVDQDFLEKRGKMASGDEFTGDLSVLCLGYRFHEIVQRPVWASVTRGRQK